LHARLQIEQLLGDQEGILAAKRRLIAFEEITNIEHGMREMDAAALMAAQLKNVWTDTFDMILRSGVSTWDQLSQAMQKHHIAGAAAARGAADAIYRVEMVAEGYKAAQSALKSYGKAYDFAAGGQFGSAALEIASALQFTAAAAMAGIGAAGGQGGGGGGGGYGSQSAASSTGGALAGGQGSLTIVINGGILDMSNPEQEQALVRALQQTTDKRVVVTRGP
jgi:hypothetical protein